MLVRVFLPNLGKYNEGELVGKWVEINENSEIQDFEEYFKEIGINEEYDEFFITEYEAPFEISKTIVLTVLLRNANSVQKSSEEMESVKKC